MNNKHNSLINSFRIEKLSTFDNICYGYLFVIASNMFIVLIQFIIIKSIEKYV